MVYSVLTCSLLNAFLVFQVFTSTLHNKCVQAFTFIIVFALFNIFCFISWNLSLLLFCFNLFLLQTYLNCFYNFSFFSFGIRKISAYRINYFYNCFCSFFAFKILLYSGLTRTLFMHFGILFLVFQFFSVLNNSHFEHILCFISWNID